MWFTPSLIQMTFIMLKGCLRQMTFILPRLGIMVLVLFILTVLPSLLVSLNRKTMLILLLTVVERLVKDQLLELCLLLMKLVLLSDLLTLMNTLISNEILI